MTINGQSFKLTNIPNFLSKVEVGKAVMFDEVVGNRPLSSANACEIVSEVLVRRASPETENTYLHTIRLAFSKLTMSLTRQVQVYNESIPTRRVYAQETRLTPGINPASAEV